MSKTTQIRQLHLVDIENLLADPRPREEAVRNGLDHYLDITGARSSDDHLVFACNHGAALSVGCCLGGRYRLRVRSGSDGADLALLEILDHERPSERFERIVIGSGDGIFADSAAELARVGVQVTVVSRPEALSNRLRLAASSVVFFEPMAETNMTVAVAA